MNPYIIILIAFAIAGIVVSIWGWTIIIKARKKQKWPYVEGKIEQSVPASHADNLLPHIHYSYSVGGNSYSSTLEVPDSIDPSKEYTARYLGKFPAGAKVRVYYDPEQPTHSTLEPGVGGDWMIFALGVLAVIFAILALFFSN